MNQRADPAIFSSKAFQKWLKIWWDADYSIASLESRGEIPYVLRYGAPISFGDRTWYSPYLPPMSPSGEICADFGQIDTEDLDQRLQALVRKGVSEFSGIFVNKLFASEVRQGQRFSFRHLFASSDIGVDSITPENVPTAFEDCFIQGSVQLRKLHQDSCSVNRSYIYGGLRIVGGKTNRLVISQSLIRSGLHISSNPQYIDFSNSHIQKLDECSFKGLSEFVANRSVFSEALLLNFSGSNSLSISMKGAIFRLGAKIEDVRDASDIVLTGCNSARGLNFTGVVCNGKIDVSNAKIRSELFAEGCSGDFLFTNSNAGTFREIGCKQSSVSLRDAIIRGSCHLNDCQIDGQLILERTEIGDDFGFRRSDATGGIMANDLVCNGAATLSASSLGRHVTFRRALIVKGLDLSVGLEAASKDNEKLKDVKSLDVRDAKIGLLTHAISLNASGRKFVGKADFQRVQFMGAPYFERDAFGADVAFRLACLKIPEGHRIPPWRPLMKKSSRTERREALLARDEAVHEAERAFSNLKDAMKAAGNSRGEKRFHILELRARRRRKDSEVGASERLMSILYDISTEYGESIRKPLIYLIATPVAAWMIFFSLGWQFDFDSLASSLHFSLEQIFRPLFIWSPEYVEKTAENNDWIADRLFWTKLSATEASWRELAIKLLSTAETILAVTLAFLLGASVKRRFQVQG